MNALQTQQARSRELAGWAIALLLALAACVYAFSALSAAHDQALRATSAQEESQRLVAIIAASRGGARAAGTDELELDELTRVVEAAAQAAGLEQAQLSHIWPQPARREADSDYRAKPTDILLQGVSLPEAVRFIETITNRYPQVTPTALRILAADRQARSNQWRVEIRLTYLIFSPQAGRQPLTRAAASKEYPQ